MMPRFVVLLMATFTIGLPSAALLIATEAEGSNGVSATPKKMGHEDFLSYCAACHGVTGKGDGTVAEFLTITAKDLTQISKQNKGLFPREHLVDVIDGRSEVKVHGARDMPIWGDFFKYEQSSSNSAKGASEKTVRQRISRLVDFIETIQEK